MVSSETKHRAQQGMGPGEFSALAASLMGLFALSIDMMLPAFAQISTSLHIDGANDTQWIVFIVILGMGLGQLVYGPVSDVTGRKPAICVGLMLFLAGSAVAALAPDLTTLLCGRFLQGLGAAGARIVTLAIVRDQYAGTEMARIMSFVVGVLMIGPVVAPFMGQGILLLGSWRVIFAFLFFFALAVLVWLVSRQSETLAASLRTEFAWPPLRASLHRLVRTRATMGYSVAAGLVFGGLFAYIGSAQQIYQTQYDVGEAFPFFLGLSAVAIGAASFLNGGWVRQVGLRRMTESAVTAKAGAGLALFGIAILWSGHPPLWVTVSSLCAYMFFAGMLFGNLNALAMDPVGDIAGTASGVVGSITWMVAALVGALIGQHYDGTIIPLTAGLLLLSCAIWGVTRWTGRTAH